MAARQSERRELTPSPQLDLRDVLRAALAETGTLAAERQVSPSFFRFGELALAVRILGPAPLQRLLGMIATRAAGPSHDAVLLDVIGGPVKCLEGLLPMPDMCGRTVLRANEDLYYLWLDEAGGYVTIGIDNLVVQGSGRGSWFGRGYDFYSRFLYKPFSTQSA